MLMAMMSALHNLNRSVGCALLVAASGKTLAVVFLCGEVFLYLLMKIMRGDFWYWMQVDGVFALSLAFIIRALVKVITDFTGCMHFRHPFELGGVGFGLSMAWAQAFPFVALQIFVGDSTAIKLFLIISFTLWLLLNVFFFCTINLQVSERARRKKKRKKLTREPLQYVSTFFELKTGPQYSCELYLTSEQEYQKFDSVFSVRRGYTKTIHDEIEEWVATNIQRWQHEKPEWFKIEMIPDELLPMSMNDVESRAKRECQRQDQRRRSSFSDNVNEIVGGVRAKANPAHARSGLAQTTKFGGARIAPENLSLTNLNKFGKGAFVKLAKEVYETRSSNNKSNKQHIKRIFEDANVSRKRASERSKRASCSNTSKICCSGAFLIYQRSNCSLAGTTI